MRIIQTIILQIVLTLSLGRNVLGLVATRTTADRIRSFGYSSETHTVVTKDGFVLTLFRITKSARYDSRQSRRPVVLMMHGLAGSSDCWIINGPSNALAFNLADSGYDVWLGNSRGNPYSSRHVSMSPKDRKFWRFSWDIMAVIDLPHHIDYILKVARQSSLHYVGHSQGTAIMMSLLSTLPSYNNKLKSAHFLAPIAYMTYATSKPIRIMAPLVGTYNQWDPLLGDRPFFQNPQLQKILGISRCRSPLAHPELCIFWATLASGYSKYIPRSLLPETFNTHPASCSTHQFIHLVQLHVSGHFRPYDFGVEGNLQRYNRTTPPDYKMTNINPRFPLHLYYSAYDVLSSKADVEHLSQVLGTRSVRHFIDLPNFAHFDFLWAANVKDVINRGILQRMNSVEALFRQSYSYNNYFF